MLFRTMGGFAVLLLAMGVLTLLIPQGWDTAPLAKIGVAGFFIGIGGFYLWKRR
jgi:hypothetical protein